MKISQQVIEKYKSGMSILALSKEYAHYYSYRDIRKMLVKNNIPIRGGRNKKTLTDTQLQYLKKEYCENGTDLKVLAAHFNWDKETLRNLIEEKGWQKKTTNRVNKRIIENFFSVIDTEEKAYFLGLLITDGTVDKRAGRQGRIRLQLQAKDKNILIKFKEILQIDSNLVLDQRGNQCYSVEFSCEQMFQDLKKYGIVPQKTYLTTNLPTNIPKHLMKHFLRGMLDGDGCITFDTTQSKDVSINFTSYHESFVKDFQQSVDNLIKKENSNKLFYTSAWHCSWRGYNQVLKILDCLYQDATIYLQRKYDLYQKLKNRN